MTDEKYIYNYCFSFARYSEKCFVTRDKPKNLSVGG